jgi:Domain of unknown function (4846)/D-alanyl-D-alanine carboxypeptidase
VRGVLCACAGMLIAWTAAGQAREASRSLARNAGGEAAIPRGLRCLQAAYPEHVCGLEANALVLCDGRTFVYDDGREKTHEQRLEEPDLEDMLAEPYRTVPQLPPAPNSEPGRVRFQPLFDAMYGSTQAQVRSHLTRVAWLARDGGRSIEVTRVNGVDARLRAVSAALEQLSPELRAQAAQLAGTFNWRPIAGTERRSAHSYGIAIDVAPKLSDYWRWREPGVETPVRYRNRMPLEIVAAFEREGFIWGGRWSHYDTMHFEYRPELLVLECRGEGALPPAAARVAEPAPPSVSAARVAEPAPPSAAAPSSAAYAWPHTATESLRQRFAPPRGFERAPLAAGSFGAWLRELPVEPGRGTVQLYDGRNKPAQNLHAAVIAIDTGQRDLQQCADAVMRLRAEYLFGTRKPDEVCFRAISGDAMPYASYRKGLRPPKGRAAPWTAQAEPDSSWSGFRAYLDRVFGLANTASLARELEPVQDVREITAGDVYIEGAHAGRFGHAVLVLDVAQNFAGERVFLIAQSYMPAQAVHVLINPVEPKLGAWYRAPANGSLETPEWSFPSGSLRRFTDACHR